MQTDLCYDIVILSYIHNPSHIITYHIISHVTIYSEQVMSELMRENDDIATKRKACKEMHDLLLSALEIVNEVVSGDGDDESDGGDDDYDDESDGKSDNGD